MPFPEQPVREFTRAGIEALKRNQNGVYGIFRQDHWVYIGKGDIRQRLLDHLNGDNLCITRHAPAYYVAEVLSGDPSIREKELILECNPSCNQKVG